MEQVEFKLLSTTAELTQAIRWNFDEVKAYVAEVNSNFTGIQYTEEEEKECKKDLAKLRKVRDALKAAKQNVKDQRDIPYNEFCEQMDSMIHDIESTINDIDSQFKEMDNKRRAEYLEKAKQLYDMTIAAAGYESWLTFEEILEMKKTKQTTYKQYFGNIGSWNNNKESLEDQGKDIIAVFQSFIKNIEEKINEIKALESQFEAEAIEILRRTKSTEEANKEIRRLEKAEAEKQAAIEEAKRKAELEAQRRVEEAERRAREEKERAELEARRKIEEERRRAEEEKQKAIREAEERAREEERRKAEAIRKAEEERKQAEEKPVSFNVELPEEPRQEADAILRQESADAVETDIRRDWVTFKAYISIEEALELKKFFDDRGIKFGKA